MIAVLRQRNFSLLWFAGFISMIGDWLLFIALPMYVYQMTHSILATSIMFIVEVIPPIVLGSVAGVFVDRWNRKYTMIIANILLALALLPLLLVKSPQMVWIAYVAAFVTSTITQFFMPAEGALLPTLVEKKDLATANSLNSLNRNAARLIGPPLGGVIAGLLGMGAIILLDAATFLIACVLIACVTVSGWAVKSEESVVEESGQSEAMVVGNKNPLQRVWSEWLDGLRAIGREQALVVLFIAFGITSIGEGIFTTLIVVFTNKVLHGGATELGWLMGAQAVGGVLGGLTIGYVASKIPARVMIWVGSILFGIGDLVLVNYPAFVPGLLIGLVTIAIVGVFAVGMSTGTMTFLQNLVANEYLGRVLGTYGTISALLMLVGTILAGTLGESVGVITILTIQGSGYIVAGLIVLIFMRPASATSQSAQEMAREEQSEVVTGNVL